jgi:hypothetical protein
MTSSDYRTTKCGYRHYYYITGTIKQRTPEKIHTTDDSLPCLLASRQSDTQSNTKGKDKDDEDTDEQAPPLKLVPASGVFIGFVDLSIPLVYVLGRLDSVLLRVLDNWILCFYDLSHICEHSCQVRKGSLDLLELVMTGPHSAED